MTDIWAEKPESKIVGFELNEYDKNGDPLCATVHHYDVLEMDAWLEKLQEEVLTAWTKDENRLTKIIIERGRKLEAVEKWRDRWGLNLSDRQYKELSDILRGSTQTANEEVE